MTRHLRGKGTAKIYAGTPSLGWRCPEAIRVRGQVTVAPTRAAPVVRTKVTWKVLPQEAGWTGGSELCPEAAGATGKEGRKLCCGYRRWRRGRPTRSLQRGTAEQRGAARGPEGRLRSQRPGATSSPGAPRGSDSLIGCFQTLWTRSKAPRRVPEPRPSTRPGAQTRGTRASVQDAGALLTAPAAQRR